MAIAELTHDQFFSYIPVSRETHEKLVVYVALLEKWQKSLNLISNTTLPHIWIRHIIDSYQAVKFIPPEESIVDIGSGAGLPGMVLALAGYNVTLIESDGKKIAFLREAARMLNSSVIILHARVENRMLPKDVTITARALASVKTILDLTKNIIDPSHKLLLFKGKNFSQELAEAEIQYDFTVKTEQSVTEPSGVILLLNNIQPRGVKPL